jgi:hypothetical protein
MSAANGKSPPQREGLPGEEEARSKSSGYGDIDHSTCRPGHCPPHPCGVCVDDGLPHRLGVHAPGEMARFVDPKDIARYERRGRMAQVRAIRREQLRREWRVAA